MRRACCASTRFVSISRGWANASRIALSVISWNVTRLASSGWARRPPRRRARRSPRPRGRGRWRGRRRRPLRAAFSIVGDLLAPVVGDRRTRARSRGRRRRRACPCPGSRAGRGRGRTRRGPGSPRRGSARSSSPWRATRRSPGSWAWRGSVAPGSCRPLHPAGARVRCRGRAAGIPRRSRCHAGRRPRSPGRRTIGRTRSEPPARGARRSPGSRAGRVAARRPPRGISRKRITWYGKKNVRLDLVDEHRALAVHHRRFVHRARRRPARAARTGPPSAAARSRQWMTTFRITRPESGARHRRWSPVSPADGPVRGGRSR